MRWRWRGEVAVEAGEVAVEGVEVAEVAEVGGCGCGEGGRWR